MVDALGHITELSYDEMNRLRERTAPLSQTIAYDYDTAGNVISITDPLGNSTTYAYDSANQLAQSTNASAQTTTFEHDEMGRVQAITDASDITTGVTYDQAGYLVATTDGLGRSTRYVYDAVGRLTDKIDAAGIVSHYEYDSAGRLAAVTENYIPGFMPDEQTNVRTEYTYDDNGNLLTVADGNRNTARSYQYNARNQVTTLTNPLGHAKSYTYSERGELASMTDGKGQTTSAPPFSPPTLGGIKGGRDLAGQLTQITRPDENVSFQYDELGRLS
jgi:YD repeat-containing protein